MSDTLPIERTLTSRFGVSKGTPQTFNTSGDHVVYAPATGYRVRLKWVGLSSPAANTAEVLATLKWHGGLEIYRFGMGNPGGYSHRTVREGAVNESLDINLSDAQTVYVNVDVEEFQ